MLGALLIDRVDKWAEAVCEAVSHVSHRQKPKAQGAKESMKAARAPVATEEDVRRAVEGMDLVTEEQRERARAWLRSRAQSTEEDDGLSGVKDALREPWPPPWEDGRAKLALSAIVFGVEETSRRAVGELKRWAGDGGPGDALANWAALHSQLGVGGACMAWAAIGGELGTAVEGLSEGDERKAAVQLVQEYHPRLTADDVDAMKLGKKGPQEALSSVWEALQGKLGRAAKPAEVAKAGEALEHRGEGLPRALSVAWALLAGHVRVVSFAGEKLEGEELAEGLRQRLLRDEGHCAAERVDVSGCTVGKSVAATLEEALTAEVSTVKALVVEHALVPEDATKPLARAIRGAWSLVRVSLAGTPLSGSQARMIGESVAGNGSIRWLDASWTGLSADNARELLQQLREGAGHLRELAVEQVALEGEGARLVAELMACPASALRRVWLDMCGLDGEDVEVLARAVGEGGVALIGLAGNTVTPKALAWLAISCRKRAVSGEAGRPLGKITLTANRQQAAVMNQVFQVVLPGPECEGELAEHGDLSRARPRLRAVLYGGEEAQASRGCDRGHLLEACAEAFAEADWPWVADRLRATYQGAPGDEPQGIRQKAAE